MEHLSGFYDDEGNKIYPNLYPKPQLCMSCTKNDDPGEEILCALNRYDQHGEPLFICYAYLAIAKHQQ